MIRQPGQLWVLFALCVCMILPAMIWLTFKTVGLDREFQEDRHQTELARREAELQEKITSALYRMDWKLGPHVAREAARPYFLYQSFYVNQNRPPQNHPATGWSNIDSELPSPLLYQTSEFVRLHFQVTPGNQISSPQRPQSQAYCEKALACCGVTNIAITQRDQQLEQIKKIVTYELLNDKIAESGIFSEDTEPGISVNNAYLQPQAKNFAQKFGPIISQNTIPQQIIDDDPQLDQKSKVQRSRGTDRGGKEFLKRQEQYTDNTSQWTNNSQIFNIKPSTQPTKAEPANQVIEGVMRPIWIGNELFLTRRVETDGQPVIQCCWLAWDVMQQALQDEVADILPDVDFEKVLDEESLIPERALVTLPVQLVVDTQPLLANTAIKSPMGKSNSFSGLQAALIVAWFGLTASVIATGILLRGVVQLSERRASFVSAVTHELRTPLTTFKMYSEMLAEKMVPQDKQIQYAETLHREADRLSHLVENVLQFARLERSSRNNKLNSFSVSELLDGIPERLAARAKESEFSIDYRVDDAAAQCNVQIEPHILDQVLFNLVDNACKYAIDAQFKTIKIRGRCKPNQIQFTVRDFGPGIAPKDVYRVFQPFHKSDLEAANSAPGVGLGLALCKRMLNSIGGKLYLSNGDKGAKFVVEIPVHTPDKKKL